MSRAENEVVFSVMGTNITILHIITLLLAVNISVLALTQYRRSRLEEMIRELLK